MPGLPLECPGCGTGGAAEERFCARCGSPLVIAGATLPLEADPARERARLIHPPYAEGPLVKVARASNQPEAELLQALLLDAGVPSLARRSGGFDVPDFLASGPRDILVPSSGAEAAREILQLPEPAEGIGMAPGEGTPAWVKAMAVALTVVILAIIAAGVYAAIF